MQLVSAESCDVDPAEAKAVQVYLPGGIRVEVPTDQKELLLELVTTVSRQTSEVSP